MGMKTVEVKTERVLDDNSNTYLKRAEEKLKNREYDDAISEVELAIEYSNNNEEIIEQCDRIKLALVRGNIKTLDFFFENRSEEEIRKIAVKVINNFKGLLNSLAFKLKCKIDSYKFGCDSYIIKNLYVRTCIERINDVLKIEGSIYSETILGYNDFFNKATKNINQYNIKDCKMLIGKFYLVNIEDAIFVKK